MVGSEIKCPVISFFQWELTSYFFLWLFTMRWYAILKSLYEQLGFFFRPDRDKTRCNRRNLTLLMRVLNFSLPSCNYKSFTFILSHTSSVLLPSFLKRQFWKKKHYLSASIKILVTSCGIDTRLSEGWGVLTIQSDTGIKCKPTQPKNILSD